MRIIFYGTPHFAVASLEKLVEKGFDIVAVVTSPDKPSGRGLHLNVSAVKQCALKLNLTVLQPENLKNPDFIDQLTALKPDLQIIIAFRMLPEAVWNLPPLGTLNLHGSLLPDYRGAAPINWAIINGERKTGITTFFLKHAIDTGDIILQREIEILKDDDAGTLHDKMMLMGADLVAESLTLIGTGNYSSIPQNNTSDFKIAPKIFTRDCQIDWNKPVADIHNHIRGLSPYPGAFTYFKSKVLKIYQGYFQCCDTTIAGEIAINQIEPFKIAGKDGWYCPTLVQPEGKRKMSIQDFVNGLKEDSN